MWSMGWAWSFRRKARSCNCVAKISISPMVNLDQGMPSKSKGISLIEKSVSDVFRTKDIYGFLIGFLYYKNDFCQKCSRFLVVKCP